MDLLIDETVREKDKEIATLQADLKANQDLFKEAQVMSRSKANKIVNLN